ncbi:hypothetical protein [Nocardioides pantholopis]|uniref:hypothetical protein n=1 Tax=Nocardioides pantholopis TaxID=2483798 RepID=UPI0013DD95CB|nr:hypothetical protein [Nocardioides pantholopis]
MGLFSRQSRNAAPPPKSAVPTTIVTVAFRELGSRDPLRNFSPDHGYAYTWPFPLPPQIGQWAVADGWEGESSVVVGALGMPAQARGMELKALSRLISPLEVVAAQQRRDSPSHAWLDLARRAAGLPVDRPLIDRVPDGFDPLPPAAGEAGIKAADHNGNVWWRAYNLSAELGRDPDEAPTFKSIGQHWYRERDRQSKAADERRMARTIATIDLGAAIRDVRSRTRAEVEAMTFAGQPLWDWLKHAQALEKDGRADEALALLEALIIAAEQEASISGREPAPAYTERAAIIHRKRRDYVAEIAAVERWINACPPEERGPGALQGKLAERLDRARELAAKNTG